MARIFVALALPEDVKLELIRMQRLIKRLELAEGSYVRKENLHLTLKFFGDIPESSLDELSAALSSIKAPINDLKLDTLGYFPEDTGSIQVIWVSVLGKQLYSLVEAIEQKTATWSPPDERSFKPHLTLLRVKKLHRRMHFIDSLNHMRVKALAFKALEFVLMQSLLTHEGSTYKELARFSLSQL